MSFDLKDLESLVVRSARGGKRQAAGGPLSVAFSRELGEEDADALSAPPALGTKPPTIARLRTNHHQLARLLAEGTPAVQASAITGYSPSRISILQKDPAFCELMAYYKGQVAEQYLNVHERLGALGLAVVDELQERLDDDPERFTNRELMSLAELALDRSLTRPQAPQPGVGAVAIQVEFVGAPAAQAQAAVRPIIDLQDEDAPAQ